MIVAHAGFLFVCGTSAFKECFQNKTFSCPLDSVKVAEKIGIGSVLFLYNPDSKELVGPFTVKSAAMDLETGTWVTDTEHRFPTRFGVEWEEVHVVKDAQKEFPFLTKKQSCVLTETQTQRILHVLKGAPFFPLETTE